MFIFWRGYLLLQTSTPLQRNTISTGCATRRFAVISRPAWLSGHMQRGKVYSYILSAILAKFNRPTEAPKPIRRKAWTMAKGSKQLAQCLLGPISLIVRVSVPEGQARESQQGIITLSVLYSFVESSIGSRGTLEVFQWLASQPETIHVRSA